MKQVYENNRKSPGIKEIIRAMELIDRENFVRKEDLHKVYEDFPIHIGKGQTISQPSTVARMLLMLDLKKGMAVFEIGSGSGWNAALISFLVYPGKVVSAERINEISKFAVSNFFKFIEKKKIRMKVDFVFADALDKKEKFWKQKFDRIIVTAMVGEGFSEKIRRAGLELLKDKGLLLFPFRNGLELWKKEKGELHKLMREEGYVFVPLIGGKD